MPKGMTLPWQARPSTFLRPCQRLSIVFTVLQLVAGVGPAHLAIAIQHPSALGHGHGSVRGVVRCRHGHCRTQGLGLGRPAVHQLQLALHLAPEFGRVFIILHRRPGGALGGPLGLVHHPRLGLGRRLGFRLPPFFFRLPLGLGLLACARTSLVGPPPGGLAAIAAGGFHGDCWDSASLRVYASRGKRVALWACLTLYTPAKRRLGAPERLPVF